MTTAHLAKLNSHTLMTEGDVQRLLTARCDEYSIEVKKGGIKRFTATGLGLMGAALAVAVAPSLFDVQPAPADSGYVFAAFVAWYFAFVAWYFGSISALGGDWPHCHTM